MSHPYCPICNTSNNCFNECMSKMVAYHEKHSTDLLPNLATVKVVASVDV